MGFGISRGAYLVTQIKTLGGTSEYDVAMVIDGNGTSSSPWSVKSTLTCRTYTVCALEIISDSYRHNSKDDANAIYAAVTSKKPPEPPKPSILDINPF